MTQSEATADMGAEPHAGTGAALLDDGDTPPQSTSVLDVLLGESTALAESIASSINAHVGAGSRVEIGPAAVQDGTADLAPAGGLHGVISSLRGGPARRVVLVVDDTLRELLSAAVTDMDDVDEASAWLALVSDPLEAWARQGHATMDAALPVDNARQLDHLLLGQGLVIVAAGLFIGGRHVGSVALAGFERDRELKDVEGSEPERNGGIPAPLVDSEADDFGVGDASTDPGRRGVPGGRSPRLAALHRLADVEMMVTAELGRTRMNVSELLGLMPGSVIELDRAAGSPVDLLVNSTLIARGEVVVVDEEYGIRLTEIFGSPE